MPKHSISAAAGGLPKASRVELNECPVAPIVEEAARIRRAIELLEDRKLKSVADIETNTRMLDQLQKRIEALEAQAVYLKARSGLGALFQCGLLLEQQGASDVKKSKEITDHLVYSLRAFIQAATGAKMDAALEDYYLPEHFNPHRLFDEALAEADQGNRVKKEMTKV